MPRTLCICAALLLGICVSAQASETMRCGNRLVSVGDTKAEVVARCGTPAWRDRWTEKLIADFGEAAEQRISTARELWLYNFGPREFVRLLTFENGRLVNVDTGEHGYLEGKTATRCDVNLLPDGLTQIEVLQRCGQPFFTDSRTQENLYSIDEHTRRLIEQRVDEWTYNLGPNHFMRILVFENGRLVDTRTVGRGF